MKLSISITCQSCENLKEFFEQKVEEIMAATDDLKAALVDLQAKANTILSNQATLLTTLTNAKTSLDAEIARVEALLTATDGVSAADAAAVVSGLQGVSASLDTAIASTTAETDAAAAIGSEADLERPQPRPAGLNAAGKPV